MNQYKALRSMYSSEIDDYEALKGLYGDGLLPGNVRHSFEVDYAEQLNPNHIKAISDDDRQSIDSRVAAIDAQIAKNEALIDQKRQQRDLDSSEYQEAKAALMDLEDFLQNRDDAEPTSKEYPQLTESLDDVDVLLAKQPDIQAEAKKMAAQMPDEEIVSADMQDAFNQAKRGGDRSGQLHRPPVTTEVPDESTKKPDEQLKPDEPDPEPFAVDVRPGYKLEDVTTRQFMKRAYENWLASQVSIAKPIMLGVGASLMMHSMFGARLASRNPLMMGLSAVPAVLGIYKAGKSYKRFQDLLAESSLNDDAWTTAVPKSQLAMLSLDAKVVDIIKSGKSKAVVIPPLRKKPAKKQQPPKGTGANLIAAQPLQVPLAHLPEVLGSDKDSAVTFEGLLETAIASSVLLASLRGTGKTSLLQSLFSEAMDGYIVGLDPKNSNSLGVLEPYFSYAPPSDSWLYLAAVSSVRDELRRRNRERLTTRQCKPLWLIIDEYQTTRTAWDKRTQETIKQALSEIVNQGRERRVFVVLMGQSPLCGDIGFSGGERANMSIMALGCAEQSLKNGGGGGWDSVDRMLQSNHLIPSTKTRDRLLADLSALKDKAGQRGRILATPSGIVSVPNLAKVKLDPLPHQRWPVESDDTDDFPPSNVVSIHTAKPKPTESQPESDADRWQISRLVNDLVSKNLLPIRPVDLGKQAWAVALNREGVIESRSAKSMLEVCRQLEQIHDSFYLDDDGRLCLLAPYSEGLSNG